MEPFLEWLQSEAMIHVIRWTLLLLIIIQTLYALFSREKVLLLIFFSSATAKILLLILINGTIAREMYVLDMVIVMFVLGVVGTVLLSRSLKNMR